MKATLTAVAIAGAAYASPASAQYIGGTIDGRPFGATIIGGGPTGFGAGFANGFLRAQMARAAMANALAAQAQTEANSPYGHCVALRADAILRKKLLPPANVVHAQMDAVRAYCGEAFC